MRNADPIHLDVRFTQMDVEAFARLSRDCNPLHIDPDYARRSTFGGCIVHGAIGVLAALDRIGLAERVRVTSLSASFKNPMFVDRTYTCQVEVQGDNCRTVTLRDGTTLLTQIGVTWAPIDGEEPASHTEPALASSVENIVDHDDGALEAGIELSGEYPPTGLGTCYPRALRMFGETVLDTIALCSFLTGMKLPGRRALFSALTLTFEHRESDGALNYLHATQSFHRDYGLLETRLVVGDAHKTIAQGELRSFVRKTIVDLPVQGYLTARSDSDAIRLAGKVAFVTGGSRGLGAALVRCLAVLGCHVYLNYLGSAAHARAVVDDLESHGLSVTLIKGDVGDRAWLDVVRMELLARHGRLDILICNACEPPLRMEDDAPSFAVRREHYLSRNLQLVNVPLAVFSDLLAASQGVCVAISSEMVDSVPAGYAHYVDLKRQTEACVRHLADTQPSIRTLIARPPNLLTEMSNTPTRIINAHPPNEIAMRIVNALPVGSDRHHLLASFTDDATPRAPETLMVTASFALDAMLGEFDGWLTCLPGEQAARQTGYNRMMQDLLSPDSVLNIAEGTVNLLYLRVSDWLHDREACWQDQGLRLSEEGDFIRRVVDDFVAALHGFAERSRAWELLIVCPDPRLDPADVAGAELLATVHARLRSLPVELPGLTTVFACDHHALHRIDATRIDDASRNRIAHIPYVQDYFGFLALLAIRMLNARRQLPAKVVVLDCDNTLWHGVCGEESDVVKLLIDDEMRAFQKSMKALLARGFILCLCSKNREEDVWKVFDQHPDMILTREDITAAKINWLPKSDNLRMLSDELGLGMNSFVFFDDNPLECAEVRAGAPEVLTVCTTQSGIAPSEWAERLWVFDQLTHTREDSARARMYREQSERERFRQSTESFRVFIDGLNLNVAIEPLTAGGVDRASQMTMRTNQFNNTTIRRDKAEIIAMMNDDTWRLVTIDVIDRFGDYGTAGFVAYRIELSCLYVDAFLLSCRVLGRTVEDRVARYLATVAGQHGVEHIHVAFVSTRKNMPFQQFLDKLAPSEIMVDDEARGETGRYVFELGALRETLDRQAWLEHGPRAEPDGASSAPPFVVGASPPIQGTDYVGIAERSNRAFDAIGAIGASGDEEPASGAAFLPDTLACGETELVAAASGAEHEAALLREVKLCYARVLSIDPDTLSEYEELERYGLESIDVVNLTVELTRLVPRLGPTFLFAHRTLRDVVRGLIAEYDARAPGVMPEPKKAAVGSAESNIRSDEADEHHDDIAIVGLHGVYPGADDMEAFWQLLRAGESHIVPMPLARRHLIDRALPGVASTLHGYMDRAGYLDSIECFEAELFGITPKEAELMDPQQRLFLQVVWGLLEDAGYTRQMLDRATGVFVGVLSSDYAMYANLHALQYPEQYRHTDYYQIANRVSYHFDLNGPSMSIDAACASSGTAFHLACQAIRDGDCESAIVGGVNLILHPSRLVQYTQTGMLSGSGSCTPFGHDADGTLLGEGIGAVLLKRLSRARVDGDNIHAVVKASSVNSGGKTNGFTVPNPNAQASLIAGALRASRVPVQQIAYVEAHGTGTALGDPIEVGALGRAFRELGATGSRRIGSVKANVGHGESNAFLASLSKVLLQFRHRQWVPTLTSAQDNTAIDFSAAGFEVQRTLADWPVLSDGESVSACISNFGAGGSNAHVVLQAWPASAGEGRAGRHLIPLSAHRPALLPRLARRLRDRLMRDDPATIDLDAVAYTLQVGRHHLDHRVVFVVDSRDALLDALERFQGGVTSDARWMCGSTTVRNRLGELLNEQVDMRALLYKWGREQAHHQIAQLWLNGLSIPWDALHETRKPVRVSLPTYPFDGSPHWLEHTHAAVKFGAESSASASVSVSAADPALFAPTWTRADLPTASVSMSDLVAHHIVFCGIEADAQDALRTASRTHDTRVHFVPQTARPSETDYAGQATALMGWLREWLREGLRERLHLQVTVVGAGDEAWTGLAALLKSAMQENPLLSAQLVAFDEAPDATAWFARLRDEMRIGHDVSISYRPERHVRTWYPLAPPARPFFEGLAGVADGAGAYLITGGSGALALQCAEWLCERDRDTTIVLLARRDEAELMRSAQGPRFDALRAAGRRIAYRSVDVCDGQALDACVAEVVATHGPIRGVLHCAGVIRDGFLIHKSEDDFQAVLAPKVGGVLNLDRATLDQPLAFFALFSSISGVLGNAGQADYAAANAFMDAFAHRRAARQRAGERTGRSVSINWPLWRGGGMMLDAELATLLREQHGLDAITGEAGMRALDRALASDIQQVFVGTGAADAVAHTLAASDRRQPDDAAGTAAPLEAESATSAPNAADLYPYLKRMLADATKLDPVTIDEHRPLADLGLDSILLAKLNKVLAVNFRQLPRTLFYEYPTLAALAAYLAEQIRYQGIPAERFAAARATVEQPAPAIATSPAGGEPTRRPLKSGASGARGVDDPIAIIGIGGRYPNAPSFDAFWQRLKTESSEIGELPVHRWHGPGADAERDLHPTLRNRKGAFLDDFAQFDPTFFQIAPIDAYSIDPQERLVLMSCWTALESSGYTRERIASQHGRNVAVCVGATKSGFNQSSSGTVPRADDMDAGAREPVTSTSFANMANRVSYFLDLHGPSIAFDTMCTSSLTAIHHACQYLRQGEVELAIAAGVNLYLHPNDYLALDRLGMLSDEARVNCFSLGGNGFIPGEAVGAVVLKRLDRALADGDRIDGVITATGISHSGRTHGYTAPSVTQQETLIGRVIERAGRHIEEIAYIESAANGSSLGDAVEWGALKKVFHSRTQPCPIGSVKPNIGHPEAAAGIVQLSKVIAQLRHRALAPTLADSSRLDHDLLADSGLRLVTRYEPWPESGPSACLITSAGAGGTYAAMVVEPAPVTGDAPVERADAVAIALSARSSEALRRVAAELHDQLAAYPDLRIEDVARTLHMGREAMKVRTGCVVESRRALMSRLRAMTSGEPAGEADASRDTVATVPLRVRLEAALRVWLAGHDVDWPAAYGDAWASAHVAPRALPGYPFDTREYWREPSHARRAGGLVPARRVLPALPPAVATASVPLSAVPSRAQIQAAPSAILAEVKNAIRALLHVEPAEEIDDEATFFELGVDSIRMVSFVRGMASRLSIALDETALFDVPTVARFSAHLARLRGARDAPDALDTAASPLVPTARDDRTRVAIGGPDEGVILRQLKTVVAVILDYPDPAVLDDDVTFFELGVDSIRMVGFVEDLSARLALDLEETVLFDYPTLAAMARHVATRMQVRNTAATAAPASREVPAETRREAAGGPDAAPLGHEALLNNLRRHGRTYEGVVPLQTEGDGPLVFCLHPASGDVAMFGKLAMAAGDRFRVIGLKARGFLTNQPHCADAEEMARYHAEIIQAIDPVGPYHVMGASMGGVVAYEVARALQDAGRQVRTVFMLEAPLVTCERDSDIFTLDALQNWLANANFLMIAMLHLDPAFRQRKEAGLVKWDDLVITAIELGLDESALRDDSQVESRLVDLIVGRGVRQTPGILRSRLRSMADTHRNNLRCMREYRWRPLVRPDEVEILMFRTMTARATSDQVYNPNYLENLQRVHGSMMPMLDAWVERMSQVRTVVVGGEDHFDLCNRTLGDEAVIGPMLASMRRAEPEPEPEDQDDTRSSAFRVAVIGISARFPGADHVDAFWNVLASGESLIRAVPAERFGLQDDAPDHGCLFERIDEFDHAFFNLSPNEARMMEPAERMFLQEAWHAVEDAGLVPDRGAGENWGVFAGSGGDYNLHVQSVLGIAPQVSTSTVPGRVAYQLNLHGPTMTIDAGCASSLLAVGQACDSLRLGQCEVAIAGGAMVYSTRNLIATGHYYRLLSKTARGAALDAGATGMLPGEAVGAVVLKPLDAALRDGDRIYAVLDAWGSNHNGRTQGIAAPSAASQAALLTSIHRRFGIDPNTVDFFEANASGAPLGDKVELQGLRMVFGGRPRAHPLALGTVENTVGHSFAASGMAHLLKVILALHREMLPPTANVDAATAVAGGDDGLFEIPARARPWPSGTGAARRAGVSSYSATGINVHLVVSEAPPAAAATSVTGPTLLAFSAATPEALRQRGRDLLDYVAAMDDQSWAPARLSAHLLSRRLHFRHRCALLARDRADAGRLLARFVANEADAEVLTNTVGATTDDDPTREALRREAAAFGATRAALPLDRAAQWYVHDIAFDARGGFASVDRVPLSLPGYPFARSRHWLEASPVAQDVAAQPVTEDPRHWLLRQIAVITGEVPDAAQAEASWSAMGFDSLMSIRLLSTIQEQTGIEIPLVDLLDQSTPAALLAHLDALGAFAHGQCGEAPGPDTSPLPPVQYAWFGDRLAALRATAEVVTVALRPQAPTPASRSHRDRMLAELLDAGIAVFRDTDKAVLLAARSVGIDARLRRLDQDTLAACLGMLAPGQLWAPLSQEQARDLHWTERMGSTAWNVFHVFRLYAHEVDLERLRHALTLLAQEQDLLRTRYITVGDGHAQCVSELVCVSLDSISIDSSEAFHQFIQSRRCHPLLEEHGGPAIRMWLTEVDGAFHLGMVAHHAHADAFTPGLLFSQLMALYGSLGSEAGARDDTRRWADQYWFYALRQHDARGASADAHRAWWRDTLAGVEVEMRLPYRKEVTSSPSLRALATNQIVPVSAELGERIKDLSRVHGISYPQLFAAVLAIVLRECFGNDRPVLQVIHNQRDSAALAACLGDFSNVAFVPFELDPGRSVIDTLYAVRRVLLTALQHTRVPMADLFRIAGVDGHTGYGAMVGDVVLDSADMDTANVNIAGEHGVSTYMNAVLEQRSIHFLDQALASLFFQFLRIDGRLYIFHAYRRALFEQETMQKLPQLIVELADAMLRTPDVPVADLIAAFGRRFDELGRGGRALTMRDAPAAAVTGDSAALLERFLGGDLSIAQLRGSLHPAGTRDRGRVVAE
jgi:FkbH-like protein